MNWDQLLSAKRLGSEDKPISGIDEARSQFQRDFDRVIFSSPFRRLQNKTQVFPLPGSVFVHNRLTHSLEVASVGRSIASKLGLWLKEKAEIKNKELLNELGSIVGAACLCHDLGNPPFGHSGEKAISLYFTDGEGKELQNSVTEKQWLDITHFEGNANAFRLLTHQFNGRRKGGFALTYSTLASLVKYPYGADAMGTKSKYGFFTSEETIFQQIAKELQLICISDSPLKYARHPLVYLVEAADDISYLVMDIEDAHKLKILTTLETLDLLLGFFDTEADKSFFKRKADVFAEVTDVNEQIAFLRASVINRLADEAISIFKEHYTEIMEGSYNKRLMQDLPHFLSKNMKVIEQLSITKIYNHPSVIEVELTGYNVIGNLLNEFVGALKNPEQHYSKKLLALLPMQFQINGNDKYLDILSILDFISGMTDLYALELYQTIKGIKLK
jgi:dGTPase